VRNSSTSKSILKLVKKRIQFGILTVFLKILRIIAAGFCTEVTNDYHETKNNLMPAQRRGERGAGTGKRPFVAFAFVVLLLQV
jgi:hypothetical protein